MYAAALKEWESPWLDPSSPDKNEGDLKVEYYQSKPSKLFSSCTPSSHACRNANQLNHSLQLVGEEVTCQTTFKTFFMWGGLSESSVLLMLQCACYLSFDIDPT